MTSIEKAERALNHQIEQMQGRLRAATSENPRPDFVRGLVIWVGLGETITEYVSKIGDYAKLRHSELKGKQVALVAEHDHLLQVGQEQLERFKINPTDSAIREAIEQTQRSMAAVQKTLRRSAASLQQEVNPSIRSLDTIANYVRRLCESDDKGDIKRWTKAIVRQPAELCGAHPALRSKGLIDTVSWENSASAAIDEATDFLEAQARAGFQAMLALEIMIMAISTTPPQSAEEAANRANAAVALRTNTLMERLAANECGP